MILTLAICLLSSPLREHSVWTAPSQLPFQRVHAIARVDSETFIGGLRGLYKGGEGNWTKLDERPVKQMVVDRESIWVLYGDGSLDKIEPRTNRLVFDVLNGNAKRPWTSCLYRDSKGVVLGGLGGWIERGGRTAETYRKEFGDDVVTSLCRTESDLWIGTQRKGLFSFNDFGLRRFGFAAGLPDSWITATLYFKKHLLVGVADGGIVQKLGNKFISFESPSRKVRFLAEFHGRLVVGGMEGCWVQDGTNWQQLSTEETTCLSLLADKLAVGSPTSLRWWSESKLDPVLEP